MMAVLVIVALIIYGSLYPWTFQSNPYARADYLFRSFPPLTPRVIADAALNIVIYVPVGLTLFLQLRKSVGRVAGWLLTVAFAFGLSFSLEYAQFFQRTRIPNSLDVLTNTAGGAVGASAAGLWLRLSSRVHLRSPVTLLLWIAWIGSLLFPLIPVFGLYALRVKLARFLTLDTSAVLGFCLQWLIAGALLMRRNPQWIGATLLLVPAQLFFAGRQPTLGMLAGGLCGAALAVLPVGRRTTSAIALALLALWQLAPLRVGQFHGFCWIPFADAVQSAAVAVVLTKIFVHAGCIALMVRGGWSLAVSAFVVAALLAATEAAQMWIPGRTPASTDPVIALLAAAALVPSRGRVGD